MNIPINAVWDLSEDVTIYDKDTLVSAIINKGATFEPIYAEPNYLKIMSDAWWYKWKHTFEQWFLDFQIEYNPIYNFDKYHEFESHINDIGTDDTVTTGREVTDIDTTGTKTSQEVMDDDTTGSKTARTVVDEDTTGSRNNRNVIDEGTTDKKTGTVTEVTDEDTTMKKTGTDTVVNDTDTTLKRTGTDTTVGSSDSLTASRTPGISHNNGSIPAGTNSSTSENLVSAFDANDYQPHDKNISSSTQSTDTYVDASNTETLTHNTTDTGTSDTTETTTHNTVDTGTDDISKTTTYNTTDTSTRDVVTTDAETTGGTRDITTNVTESTAGTDDRTTDYSERTTGTDDRTVNRNETIDNDSTNNRTITEEGHDWGNYSAQTAQEMIIKDLKKNYFNIYNAMADIFCREMCVRVF